MLTPTDYWAPILVANPALISRAHAVALEADDRRRFASYNTGSITEAEAYNLLALAESVQAQTIIEVGTFIGRSGVVSGRTSVSLMACYRPPMPSCWRS